MRRHLGATLRFAATTIVCGLVLFARSPDLFLAPKFVLEDGTIFFAQAYNRTPADALLAPYAGYFHLVPRLAAEIAAGLPPAAAPLFLAITALVLSSTAIGWFVLPHYRALVQEDWLRVAFAVLLVLLPGLDGPVLIAYTQWYLALWGMLLIFMTPPRRRWVQWVLACAYVAALATAPVLFVLFPLWVWRFMHAPARGHKKWIGLILAATAIMVGLTLWARAFTPPPPPMTGTATAMAWDLAVIDTLRAAAFRVFVLPLTGYVAGNEIVRVFGWWAIYGLAILVGALLLWATFAPANRSKRAACLGLLYAGASTTALYLDRAPLYNYAFVTTSDGIPFGALRYFFLAIAAALLIALTALDRWVAGSRARLTLAMLGVAAPALLYFPNFSLPAWGAPNWPQYARLLGNIVDPQDAARAGWSPQYPQPQPVTRAGADTGTLGLRIPIAPEGWTMRLDLPPGRPQGYVFPGGLRLLGLESTQAGATLLVTVFWQAPGVPEAGEATTAYVHLLDATGERITGTDVLMTPPTEDAQGDTVWSTRHELALPAGIAPGRYDAAVGLYRLAGDTITPEGALILRAAVEIE